MNRLKDRNRQIPNGLTFYLPAINWRPQPWSSFNSICTQLQNVIRGNKALAQTNNWPQTPQGIEEWVDQYNTRICEKNGWTAYLTMEGPAPPKPQPPPSRVAHFGRLAAGAATLLDWLGEGGVPVETPKAHARAAICAGCPQNKPGDLLSWFTKPASALIQRQIEKRNELKLGTPHDEQLGICDACGCPLKLKVHVPLPEISRRLPEESRAALDPRCWILHDG